jgi:hypothetical protein
VAKNGKSVCFSGRENQVKSRNEWVSRNVINKDPRDRVDSAAIFNMTQMGGIIALAVAGKIARMLWWNLEVHQRIPLRLARHGTKTICQPTDSTTSS